MEEVHFKITLVFCMDSPPSNLWPVQLAAPVVEPRSGVLIPPGGALHVNSPLKVAPGGIDSLRSPLLGPSLGLAPSGPTQALFKNAPGIFVRAARPAAGLSNWLRQLSNPGRGFSSPPVENIKEKSPYFRTGSHLEYGGEGGIRTPDTLPYTHFPGVLLQPLGHLTILSFRLLPERALM